VVLEREKEQKTQADSRLDPRVQLVCELLKSRNELPSTPEQKGGRPRREHRSVLIAVHTQEAIERCGERWGSKEQAFREVAEGDGASYDHVKDIYQRAFGKRHDPDFRQAVDLTLRDRKEG
jgi:hypothetical protein